MFQRVVDYDWRTRVENRRRLVALAAEHGDEVRVDNARDPVTLHQCARRG